MTTIGQQQNESQGSSSEEED